jgi:hypothetical protein
MGSFPPTCLRDYPAMIARQEYKSVEKEFQSRLGRMSSRLGISEKMRRERPGLLSQLVAQAVWLVYGVGVFSMCGRKRRVRGFL